MFYTHFWSNGPANWNGTHLKSFCSEHVFLELLFCILFKIMHIVLSESTELELEHTYGELYQAVLLPFPLDSNARHPEWRLC